MPDLSQYELEDVRTVVCVELCKLAGHWSQISPHHNGEHVIHVQKPMCIEQAYCKQHLQSNEPIMVAPHYRPDGIA